jgi:hypothetical protein
MGQSFALRDGQVRKSISLTTVTLRLYLGAVDGRPPNLAEYASCIAGRSPGASARVLRQGLLESPPAAIPVPSVVRLAWLNPAEPESGMPGQSASPRPTVDHIRFAVDVTLFRIESCR